MYKIRYGFNESSTAGQLRSLHTIIYTLLLSAPVYINVYSLEKKMTSVQTFYSANIAINHAKHSIQPPFQ